MCFYHEGYSEFHTNSYVKARKGRRCEACSREIVVGELCHDNAGVFEGDWYNYKICGACALTQYRIHIEEIREGCHWHQSWCPWWDLIDYCGCKEFEMSTHEEGQRFVEWKREKGRLKKPAKPCNDL